MPNYFFNQQSFVSSNISKQQLYYTDKTKSKYYKHKIKENKL